MINFQKLSRLQYFNPIKLTLTLAITGVVTLLQGCAIHTQGYAAIQATVPENPPGIIRGQPATFYGEGTSAKFDSDIMQNWRDTGLFSSVNFTNNKSIPIKGSYIKTSCYSSTIKQGGDHGFIGMLLRANIFLITAGMIDPVEILEKTTCNTNVYQNGVVIGSSSTTHSYKLGNGWIHLLTSNEKKIIRETEELTAHAMVAQTVLDMDARTKK